MDLKLWQEIDQNEPIPEHILKRMEELRQKGAILPEEKYIKRPTMIEGIRKASLLNKQVLDEVEKHIHVGMISLKISLKKMVVLVRHIIMRVSQNMYVHR